MDLVRFGGGADVREAERFGCTTRPNVTRSRPQTGENRLLRRFWINEKRYDENENHNKLQLSLQFGSVFSNMPSLPLLAVLKAPATLCGGDDHMGHHCQRHSALWIKECRNEPNESNESNGSKCVVCSFFEFFVY